MKKRPLKFNSVEYLGLFAGAFSVAGSVQQISHTYKTRSANDISYIFLLAAMVSTAMWITYHYLKRGGGPFVSTLAMLAFLLIILAMKIHFQTSRPASANEEK